MCSYRQKNFINPKSLHKCEVFPWIFAVSHPSVNQAQTCLASENRRVQGGMAIDISYLICYSLSCSSDTTAPLRFLESFWKLKRSASHWLSCDNTMFDIMHCLYYNTSLVYGVKIIRNVCSSLEHPQTKFIIQGFIGLSIFAKILCSDAVILMLLLSMLQLSEVNHHPKISVGKFQHTNNS